MMHIVRLAPCRLPRPSQAPNAQVRLRGYMPERAGVACNLGPVCAYCEETSTS